MHDATRNVKAASEVEVERAPALWLAPALFVFYPGFGLDVGFRSTLLSGRLLAAVPGFTRVEGV